MNMGMTVVAIAAGILTCDGAVLADMGTFRGFRALVVEPENSWTWDSAIFGALEERAFEVSFGRIPDDPAALRRYDLMALSIKRNLSATETENLKRYVRDGGAIYGSWVPWRSRPEPPLLPPSRPTFDGTNHSGWALVTESHAMLLL